MDLLYILYSHQNKIRTKPYKRCLKWGLKQSTSTKCLTQKMAGFVFLYATCTFPGRPSYVNPTFSGRSHDVLWMFFFSQNFLYEHKLRLDAKIRQNKEFVDWYPEQTFLMKLKLINGWSHFFAKRDRHVFFSLTRITP